MFSAIRADSGPPGGGLDRFDRVVIFYLVLPLPIFLCGWLELWAALPLTLCVLYALRPLMQARAAGDSGWPVSKWPLVLACLVGCAWTVLGGTGHFVFANPDWYVRDAVLHDLVASPWPVGYGVFDGKQSLLRAPLGFYLPAALLGKSFGLQMAHLAMVLWTAAGATLFLLQVLSLTRARAGASVAVVAVIVLFSGFDILGQIISNPRFLDYWKITQHLEWLAGSYQYSSITTQLFWVPNHALGAWLAIGLLCRDRRGTALDAMLPMILVAVALWSPLSALGLVPFVLLKVLRGTTAERLRSLLHPRVWGPAVLVGLVVASYLTLDSVRLPTTLTVTASDTTMSLLRLLQFFLLEAGLIGFAVLALRWSWEVVLALAVLLLLPIVHFGPANDLVMRASIPSLAILAIAACTALTQKSVDAKDSRKKLVLGCMIAIGAITPIQEVARAVELPAWPVDREATLIQAACGQYPPHYTAHLDGQMVSRLLRRPHPIASVARRCGNPAVEIMLSRNLL